MFDVERSARDLKKQLSNQDKLSIQDKNPGSSVGKKDTLKEKTGDMLLDLDSSRLLGWSMPEWVEFSSVEVAEERSQHSGDSGWRRSKRSAKSTPKKKKRVVEDAVSYIEEVQHVEMVIYDPVEEIVVTNCCPSLYYRSCPCCVGNNKSKFWYEWNKYRKQTSRLIENQYFETFVLALILISSAVMTLEDVHFDQRPMLVDTLYYLDRIITVVFFLETCLKLHAMGFVSYFTNAWCWLDFVIVGVSIIDFAAGLLGANNIPIFKTMRTLRALRPLRAMAKMEGMKVVVNALVGALPSIFNVLLVCLIFWLIFAIIGVNIFRGYFQECIDMTTGLRFNKDVVPNKTICLTIGDGIWTNPR